MSRSVFVIANHRTGSSCLAGILHKLGCNMGRDLLGPHRSNPGGHFEDKEVLNLNDEVIGDWRDPSLPDQVSDSVIERYQDLVSEREKKDVWGVKDPRLCLTAQLMIPFAEDPRVIAIHRPKGQSVHSLAKREVIPYEEAEEIYDKYDKFREETLATFEDLSTLRVTFDDLLYKTADCIELLEDFVFEDLDVSVESYRKHLAESFVNPEYKNF